MQVNREFLLKLHLVIAGLILPGALMLGITGALYNYGVEGSYSTTSVLVNTDKPLGPDLAELLAVSKRELQKRNIEFPNGWAGVIRQDSSYYLDWRGFNYSILLRPTENPKVAELTIKEAGIYRKLVLLHKAETSTSAKIYNTLFAVGLLIMFLLGYMIALRNTRNLKTIVGSLAAGLVVFVVLFLSETS